MIDTYLQQDCDRIHNRIPTSLRRKAANEQPIPVKNKAAFTILPKMKSCETDEVLSAYQSKYQDNDKSSIVASKQGEKLSPSSNASILPSPIIVRGGEPSYPTKQELIRQCHFKPRENCCFVVDDPNLDDVVLFLLNKSNRSLLSEHDWNSLACTDSEYNELVHLTKKLIEVDFSGLKEERIGYEEQTSISDDRVTKANACFLHYGGNIGSMVRYFGGEYTAAHRKPEEVISAIRDHVDEKDCNDIYRILTQGCPATLSKHFSKKNKMKLLRQGNQKSVNENKKAVIKTMNKEDRHSHLIPLNAILCRFSAYAHHVSQGMNMKKPESPRIVWDGTNKKHATDWVMNDDVDIESEPIITFGNTKMEFMTAMYNTRADYEDEEIWIGAADIKACFRYPRIHPDVCGAFSYVIDFMGFFFVSTAMVFGFAASANCWEPFRRAIERMTAVFFEQMNNESTDHQDLIDMLEFDDLPMKDTVTFTKAKKCSINKGVLDEKGEQKPIDTKIYVDDCLLCAPWMHFVKLLRSVVKAIFVVTGFPDNRLRQCAVAMDKWIGMKVSYSTTLLGLTFNTRTMTVGITEQYRIELLNLLNTTWHEKRKAFSVHELEILVGKCARLAEGANWVYHLMTHMYNSTAFALKKNDEFLGQNSRNFIEHIKKIKELRRNSRATREDIAVINFSIKKAAQQVHRCTNEYFIPKTMRREIEFLRFALQPNSGIKWETPIAHMIKRDPTATSASDACLDAGGGYSTDLQFIWYLSWPEWILFRTKKYIFDNTDGNLISINILEFISVILNYCAALTVIENSDFTDDPWPVLLAWCDNMSAVKWVNQACMKSDIGRELGRLFCGLLIGSKLGINSKWLSTLANEVADEISRLKSEHNKENPTSHHPSINYKTLFKSFPQLEACKKWTPSEELLSLIWQCVRTKNCPSLEEIKTVKQAGLGKLTIFDG